MDSRSPAPSSTAYWFALFSGTTRTIQHASYAECCISELFSSSSSSTHVIVTGRPSRIQPDIRRLRLMRSRIPARPVLTPRAPVRASGFQSPRPVLTPAAAARDAVCSCMASTLAFCNSETASRTTSPAASWTRSCVTRDDSSASSDARCVCSRIAFCRRTTSSPAKASSATASGRSSRSLCTRWRAACWMTPLARRLSISRECFWFPFGLLRSVSQFRERRFDGAVRRLFEVLDSLTFRAPYFLGNMPSLMA